VRPVWFYFLSDSTRPLSDYYGIDRGIPVDRYFIESFIEKNREHIKGTCLELLDSTYTNKYGRTVVTAHILDIEASNKHATIIDDLRKLVTVQNDTYDCIILTQVLQFIDDVDAAIGECYRILKPGGILLATVPSISRIDCVAGINGDFWRFTNASAHYLFEKKFKKENLEIQSYGNARSGIYFYAGLAQEDISPQSLKINDPNFPNVISIKAVK
jgi:SAM-dependent methyltransferase